MEEIEIEYRFALTLSCLPPASLDVDTEEVVLEVEGNASPGFESTNAGGGEEEVRIGTEGLLVVPF